MQLTAKIKLEPSDEHLSLISNTLKEYMDSVNDLVEYAYGQGGMPRMSSASFKANLPSALRGQVCLDARSVYNKCCNTGLHHRLKKPIAIWNNQNYKIFNDRIELPVIVQGKCTRISVPALTPKDLFEKLKASKLGTLRLTYKGHKLIAQIAYEVVVPLSSGTGTIGVDLGVKCPAVAVADNGKVTFVGNGRQIKQKRRLFQAKRKRIGKAKKMKALRKFRDKEQRWMRDIDHKTSRAIINFAITNNAKTIKLEKLSGIRATTRTSRKNNRSLSNWSFYRLSQYIEYKAKMAGIEVVYVNPAYTSQKCPVCGETNHAKDRHYVCKCGYRGHRDLVGARNILVA